MLVLTFCLTLLLCVLTASSASSQEISADDELEFRQLCPNGRCFPGVAPPMVYNPYRPKQRPYWRAYGYPQQPRWKYPFYRRSQPSDDLLVQARTGYEDLDAKDQSEGNIGGP